MNYYDNLSVMEPGCERALTVASGWQRRHRSASGKLGRPALL